MMYTLGRRIIGNGEILFPCVPTLIDPYMAKLSTFFEVLGKPFTDRELENLRRIVEEKLETGWRASPFSLLTVTYETKLPPHPGVQYVINTRVLTMEEQYNTWIAEREPPLFGKLADAMVLDVAAALGPAPAAPVLDVGAGTGRNALPLARLGHPVDALEPVPALASMMKKASAEENVPLNVIEGNVLDTGLTLRKNHYKLVVMAEVIASHFRDIDQVRNALAALSDTVAAGGVLLFNAFLGMDGYKPDAMARQVSQVMWSCVFTRNEFASITEALPLDRIADESALEYEKSRLPADAWPPTGWFLEWAQGLDLFALPEGKAPVELRWLTYRRR